MTRPMGVWTKRVGVMVASVVAVLAAGAGVVDATSWIVDMVGVTAAGMTATFVAGWILATATADVRARRTLSEPADESCALRE